jgi:hypothetical protein
MKKKLLPDPPDLKYFDIGDLRKGALLDFMPKLATLKCVVENNGWHNHHSTWDHTWNVLNNLRTILHQQTTQVRTYFKVTRIDNRSLAELMEWAAVLHDIAKPKCLEMNGDKTHFPGHEELGSGMAIFILQKFSFTHSQINFVSRLIRFHGRPHGFFGEANPKLFSAGLANLVLAHPHNLTELLTLCYADSWRSHENVTDNPAYRLRIKRYVHLINTGWY